MTGDVSSVPTALLHNLKHNKVLHERVVLMNVQTEDIPLVPEERRSSSITSTTIFTSSRCITASWTSRTSRARLAQCRVLQFRFNLMETSFFLRREKIVAVKHSPLTAWRKQLFILMSNTMLNATEFLPYPDQPGDRARRTDRDIAAATHGCRAV